MHADISRTSLSHTAISTAEVGRIATLSPTDRKTLSTALRIISQSASGRPVHPTALQHAQKTVVDMKAKMDQGQAQVVLTGFAKIGANFCAMIANWFSPSARKIQVRAESLSRTLQQKEQDDLRSLPGEISTLKARVEQMKNNVESGRAYTYDHNIPVSQTALQFLRELQRTPQEIMHRFSIKKLRDWRNRKMVNRCNGIRIEPMRYRCL